METRQHGATAAAPIKPHVFSKMEALVREMQDPENGVPIRPQKIFLTSIPSAFMGYDLIEWLLERLDMNDSSEAIHLANLLCQYGYFFPVGETRSLIVKDDSSLYRFQTPYYWASQNHSADTTDYAIYLTKRLAKNKQKHGLDDYEVDAYTKLKKGLQHKWDFVMMQADEQVRLAKDRKKGDKIVTDSQERAYWRVYRPPPGFNNCLESAPVPDRGNVANRVRKKTLEERKKEVEFYANQIDRVRTKVSQALEGLVAYNETNSEFDFFLVQPGPSNPWLTEDITFWTLNENIVEIPTEKRVRRWAMNFSALISDQTGLLEFTNYLRKEYCHENIRFWQAVNELRYGPSSQVAEKVKNIFEEFLKPGAPCEINIDGKTMELTQQQMKNATRFTYEAAAEHVYVLLLKKDCYPRYLRSDQYKNLLANAIQPLQKKRFFSFGGPGKKKIAALGGASSLQAQTPQPLKRHGSDEHTALTPGITYGASDIAGCTFGLQPRIDCDQPYSKSSEQLEKADDICPWDTAPVLSVVPYIGEPPLQKLLEEQDKPETDKSSERLEVKPKDDVRPKTESPKKQPAVTKVADQPPKTQYKRTLEQRQQQHARFHHSLPHNVPVKQGLAHFKPPRPDRSRSVDVNPASSHKQGCYGAPVDTRPKLSVTSPLDPDRTPVQKVLQEPKKDHTSLLPAGSYQCFERRASEGSRIYSNRSGGLPSSSWKEENKVAVPTTSSELPESPSFQEISELEPHSPADLAVTSTASEERFREIDYTVRSGHLAGQYVLPTSPHTTHEVPVGPFLTSGAATCASPATTVVATTITTTTQPVTSLQQQLGSLRLDFSEETQAGAAANSTKVAPSSPRDTPRSVVAPWQDSPPQKVTDICPWEDEESCKVDTPFVKTYATLGYL